MAAACEPRPVRSEDPARHLGAVSPRRIAFCTTHLGLGGAEKTLCSLVLGLDRRRWRPAVFHLSYPDSLADELRHHDVPVWCVGARHRWDVTAVLRLALALRRWRPNVLQTFLFHANFAGRLAGRCAGVPIIVCGARVAERRSRLPLVLDNLTCRLADHTVCVSRGVFDFTAHRVHWPRSRLSVVFNAVETDRFDAARHADRATLGVPEDALLILFIGRLDEQKAPMDLLEAFGKVAAAQPDAHLLLVGQGPLRDALERRAGQVGLAGRVHLTGWRPDVPELLKAADLFALPSRWEGMPNAVLEAMAAGLPVVATRVEGSTELVCHGRTGMLVEPGDCDGLAEALLALAQSRCRCAAMGQAGRARVAEEFTLARMVGSYERLYERLCTQHDRRCS